MNVRLVGGFIACLWLLAVVIRYFEPGLLPGLRELVDVSLPGIPAAGSILADIGHLIAAAAVFAAAWGIGRTLVTLALRTGSLALGTGPSLLSFTTASAVGLGTLSILALALSPVDLLRPAALWGIIAIGVAAATLHALRRSVRRPSLPQGGVEWAAVALIGAAGAFALIGALAPEVEYDALWYHLPFPIAYLAAGSLVDFPCQYTSYYPMGTELLFGYAIALGGPVAAKLVHFGFGGLLVLATYELGAQVVSRRVGLIAAAILATMPTVLWEASTAYIDLATAFFVVLSLGWILRYAAEGSPAALVLSALLGGLALNTKALAVLALIPLVGIAFAGRRGVPLLQRVKTSTLFTIIVPLPALAWYVRAELKTGNPVFPSLYWLFGADPALWTVQSNNGLAAFLDKFGYREGPLGILFLPYDMTMHGVVFGGSIGPTLLMFVPFLLGLRRPPRMLMLMAFFCGAYLLLWASPVSSLQMRFVLPTLAPLAILAAIGFRQACSLVCGLHRRLPVVTAGLLFAVLVFSLPPFIRMHEPVEGGLTHVLREIPLNAATGAESRDAYLARRLTTYAATQRLNAISRSHDRAIVFANEIDNLYAQPELVPDYALCLGSARALRGDEQTAYRGLREAGATYVLFERELRHAQPALALTGQAFERHYLKLVYKDNDAVLYRLVEQV